MQETISMLVRAALGNVEVQPEANLLECGLDSMKSMQLIFAIETAFSIQFDDDELIIDNFSTIERIQAQVEAKVGLGV